ncbi:translation initiation factor IF-3 [Williamsoniiplasma luminosum]|uniref:Translation initiation factor IF-3 n=1 Tax=Williamsoniiplasma luminosum TaxID=214888 RepID=A0A2K8NVD1_9MOLU|nr:translation initiation factor IF-3 [Williamsoniiplasma luminosum]ATZ17506.1 translation initiation factor IF-3 [Williamsoniiplasma luminosum]AVP49317.1 MAG: translation initiation factor IF-3 [Williamsoniiplasma luminosum]
MDEKQKNPRQPRNNNQDPINGFIRAREIFVIDEDGNKYGILPKRAAIELAEQKGLDLVQVGLQPNGVAIAKILNYGKYKYELQKKTKIAKKNQVKTENREIRLTVNIGEHDLDTKARKAREFLLDGDRVKISLKFKGREITYQDLGQATLDRFFTKIEDIAKIDKEAKLTSRFLDMYVVPKKN